MKVDVQGLYRQFYVDNNFEREDIFKSLISRFNINNALYPGSFVHITPSFFISEVLYVDSDPRAKKFFEQESSVADMISKKKTMIQMLFSISYRLITLYHLILKKRATICSSHNMLVLFHRHVKNI